MKRASSSSLVLALPLLLSVSTAGAVPLSFQYADSPGEGFFDPTLGNARRTAFEAAFGVWGGTLEGTVPVVIFAQMNPEGGDPTGAILGFAGPTTAFRDFPGAPLPNTWYGVALANQLAGQDLNGSDPEIEAVFNSDVDNAVVLGSIDWYYGLDQLAGSDVDFFSVVLHEFGHGLNYLEFANGNGQLLQGLPDIFTRFLVQPGVGRVTDLNDAQRSSAFRSNNLFWDGPNVVASLGQQAKVYAPAQYSEGSSVSHWDIDFFSNPDELLEPFYTGPDHRPSFAARALQDMGWVLSPGAFCGGVSTNVFGTLGPDALSGTAGPDVIHGLAASDTITGGGGADVICGGGGGDSLVGGKASDVMLGNRGNDTIDGGRGGDLLRGQGGDDVLNDPRGTNDYDGGGGTDTCIGTGNRAGCEF